MDTLCASPLVKSFIAGSFSGTCSTVLFQPLDLVKTRLQKSVIRTNLGMVGEMANVVRQERIIGLWHGLVPSMSRTVPGIGLHFTGLHWLQSTFGSEKPKPLESMIIGATARANAAILLLPITVMKTRYESGEFRYRSLAQGLHSTYSKEGIRALYSGLAPTLFRDVPYSALYYMLFTQFKEISSVTSSNHAMYINFTNGIMAGFLASLITQPADVIKTYAQLYPKKYGRIKTTAIFIYKEWGMYGFLRGLLPRTLRRSLMSAMAWTFYEEFARAYSLKT